MYAIEFETDIKSKFIELHDYEKLINKHARIIVLVDDTPSLEDFQKNKVEEFKKLIDKRKNFPEIEPNVDIIKLCNEANNDIF